MTLTYKEYHNGVYSLALDIAREALGQAKYNKNDAMELINDCLLHEFIDGDEWVIYNAYHLQVLEHSNNADYMVDNLGTDCLAYVLEKGGLSRLHCALAFWALYADVNEQLDNALDELIEEHDNKE